MYTPMFIAALFIVAKIWKQPKWCVQQIDDWINKCYIYKMKYYSSKEMKACHLGQHNTLLAYHVKWNKRERKEREREKERVRDEELLPFAFATAWMELESIMLIQISQVVKDKYHTISPISGT